MCQKHTINNITGTVWTSDYKKKGGSTKWKARNNGQSGK